MNSEFSPYYYTTFSIVHRLLGGGVGGRNVLRPKFLFDLKPIIYLFVSNFRLKYGVVYISFKYTTRIINKITTIYLYLTLS